MGLLTVLDGGLFSIYCTAYATWQEACGQIRLHGMTQTSKRGGLTTSPWVRIAHQQAELVRSFGSEFGLSPASRTRISVSLPEPDSESDGILS